MVIVAAGPSASSELNALKEYRTEITIFATGHAVRTLLNEDIRPDVIIITDPKPDMYKQVKGLDLDDIPLIILSTGANSVVENYSGQTYIAYQKGYDKAEQAADEAGIPVFETGGSVTTTALDIALNEEDLVQVKEELTQYGYIRRKYTGKRVKITSKPFHYLSSDGYDIYVGKNNYQNEELTFKFATGNDWWFHAKGAPGSHVIVKAGQGLPPDRTFEEAARLAAWYSSHRGADKVEVDYVEKKQVKKVNGGKPGFVIYHTNYSMVIDSDISGIRQVKEK